MLIVYSSVILNGWSQVFTVTSTVFTRLFIVAGFS